MVEVTVVDSAVRDPGGTRRRSRDTQREPDLGWTHQENGVISTGVQYSVVAGPKIRGGAMVPWDWTRETVTPEDILDAAKTMPATDKRIVMNLTRGWVAATRYLEWACAALQRGGDDGWDTASSLAKRAVCRRIDGILANNHLGCFHGNNYKKKAEYLAELKIPGLLVRNLVIDPRNDIEHAYELATEDQARNACEVAELFLRSTTAEADLPATVTLGWTANIGVSNCTLNGKDHLVVKVDLTTAHPGHDRRFGHDL
jgi:hypothetical protein